MPAQSLPGSPEFPPSRFCQPLRTRLQSVHFPLPGNQNYFPRPRCGLASTAPYKTANTLSKDNSVFKVQQNTS